MNKISFVIFLIISNSFIGFAQIPISPKLCLVTVGEDSIVQLKWHHSDTSQIDGFIVKRVIYNGVGVVSGTLNNIEVIENPASIEYFDNSNEYSTHSNPYIRAEEYAINVYLIRNDSLIFSNMTQRQSTLFLTSEWDKCTKTATFSWNEYINRNVQKYVLLYKTETTDFQVLSEFTPSQTSYTTTNLDTNTKYFFKISTILENDGNCETDTSYSNISNLYTFVAEIPDSLMILNVSVLDNSKIMLNILSNNVLGLSKYILFRDSIKIFSFYPNNAPYLYIDETDVKNQHNYYLEAIDSCGNILKTSKNVKNIVLDVDFMNRKFHLDWTETTILNEEISYYEIMANYGHGWKKINEQTAITQSANISMEQIFGNNFEKNISDVKFQIIANPNVGISDTLKSFSNIVDVPLSGILAIPNAFNPLSNDTENQFFTIKSLFVDEFHLTIFTQNGALLFQSDEISNYWDGKHKNGQLLKQGAYIYHIEYTSTNGQVQVLNGVVNLIY